MARAASARSRALCARSAAAVSRWRPDSASEPDEPGGSGVSAIYRRIRRGSVGAPRPVRPVAIRLRLEHEYLEDEGRIDVRVAHERGYGATRGLRDRRRELVP